MSDLSKLSRRKFLAGGACGTMGYGSLINTVAQLQLMNSAAASSLNGVDVVGNDYKAIVCVFLRGGCDMSNVLIPVSGNTQAEKYLTDRNVVAIRNGVTDSDINPSGENLTIPLNLPDTESEPYGLHPSLPHLANMFNSDEAAFITNVGTLAHPTNRQNYSNVGLPRQLFSHSDQVTEWMSSIADAPYTSGWGARVADLYHSTWNPDSQTSMLITAAGNNQFMNGSSTNTQYSVTSAGAISLASFGTNYQSALNSDGSYRTNSTGQRLQALERIINYSHSHLLEDGYSAVVRRARENEEIINSATTAASDIGLDLDQIFDVDFNADSSFGRELKSVARMIAGRDCLANKRQIFFVDRGGFDNHQDINDDLGTILEDVDNAIGAFNQAMKTLATLDTDFDYNQVTTFQASDFNRTWTPNSEDPNTAGTDHAWGSHAFIFGGAVQGGQLYGTFPELGVGTADDVPRGSRGRLIPTTSVDQYCAALANWFGVSPNSSEMNTIFPNLNRFEDPFGGSANLNIFG